MLTQLCGGDLSAMMDAFGTSIARRFNIRYGHTGHVFDSRYRYEPIPTPQALAEVCRYIHLNPVRALLVGAPEDWAYSDFRHFLNQGCLQQGEGVLQLH